MYVRVYIHISALLLVESRRDASDGLEASAGYHLAVYMSGSPSPSSSLGPATSPRPNRETRPAKSSRATCLLLASRGFALLHSYNKQHGHLMGTLVGK